jgi:peroxiredoxin
MKSFWKPATAFAAVALLGTMMAANWAQAGAASAQPAIGSSAPQFKLQDQTGKPVSLSDYAGKIVVLEWTNPGCPIVQRHYKAKTMTTLFSQYQPQDVVWLAINSTHDTTNAEDLTWVNEQGLKYPVLNDASGATGHAYGATNTPHMFIIDKTGKVAYEGAIDNDPQGDMTTGKVNYVSKALDEMLAGKTVSVAVTKAYGCAVHYAK